MRRTFPDFCKTVGTLEQRAQTLKIRACNNIAKKFTKYGKCRVYSAT
jgi:hypothetical protein